MTGRSIRTAGAPVVAAAHGAHLVRVGFEDSRIIDGRPASSNRALVEGLRAELERDGFRIEPAGEARASLATTPGDQA